MMVTRNDDGIIKYHNVNGKYQPEEVVITPQKGMYPFISPDGSYIIYAARLPGRNNSDLIISFLNTDGSWGKGIPLGNEINTEANEGNSFVTSDSKYLFFSRKFNIYWVSAKIIDIIRQQDAENKN